MAALALVICLGVGGLSSLGLLERAEVVGSGVWTSVWSSGAVVYEGLYRQARTGDCGEEWGA